MGFGLSVRRWTRLPCVQASVSLSGKRRTYENGRVGGVPWRQVLLDSVPQGCVQSASAPGNLGVWGSRSEAPMIQVPGVRTRLRPLVRGEACRSPPLGPAGLRRQPVSPLLTRRPQGQAGAPGSVVCQLAGGPRWGSPSHRRCWEQVPLKPALKGRLPSVVPPPMSRVSRSQLPGGCRSPAWRADAGRQWSPCGLRAQQLGQGACWEEAEAWRQPPGAVPGSSVSANACSSSHPGTGAVQVLGAGVPVRHVLRPHSAKDLTAAPNTESIALGRGCGRVSAFRRWAGVCTCLS